MRNMPTAPDKGLSGANHVAYFVASTRSRTTCRTSCQMCSTLLGRSWGSQVCCSPTNFPSPTVSTPIANSQRLMPPLLHIGMPDVGIYSVLIARCQHKFYISPCVLNFQHLVNLHIHMWKSQFAWNHLRIKVLLYCYIGVETSSFSLQRLFCSVT